MNDLRKELGLSPEEHVCLKYFEELEMKIPRQEMDIWKVIAIGGMYLTVDYYPNGSGNC